MAVVLNLTPNGALVPPLGFPIVLSRQNETVAEGVLAKYAASVTATVVNVQGVTPAGSGTAPTASNAATAANVHLALFATPTTSGGADGAIVEQTDLVGLGAVEQTITVSVPESTAPATYIVRLWVDGLTGTNGVTVRSMAVN